MNNSASLVRVLGAIIKLLPRTQLDLTMTSSGGYALLKRKGSTGGELLLDADYTCKADTVVAYRDYDLTQVVSFLRGVTWQMEVSDENENI